jgi:hypothetical protein
LHEQPLETDTNDDLEILFRIASRPAPGAADPQSAALLQSLDLGPDRAPRDAVAALERAAVDALRAEAGRRKAQAYLARLAHG